MLAEIGTALLHLDQDDRLPDQIRKGGPAAILLDALLAVGAGFLEAGMAAGAEQVVEEDGGLALFVALDMSGAPVNEGLQSGFAVGHLGRRGRPCGVHDRRL